MKKAPKTVVVRRGLRHVITAAEAFLIDADAEDGHGVTPKMRKEFDAALRWLREQQEQRVRA